MIAVDTSAVIAILAGESDAHHYAAALAASPSRMLSATYLECSIVITRKSASPEHLFDSWLQTSGIEIVDTTVEHARIARQAFRDYGKGSGHPARLNLGDCFSYALAAHAGMPLLWKGDDFSHTGLRSALTAK